MKVGPFEWDEAQRRWVAAGGQDRSIGPDDVVSFVEAFSDYHGPRARMVACLCPPERVVVTPPDVLREKIGSILLEHKASTPYDDDEYWGAQSPFDRNWYQFASCAHGGGWPTTPCGVSSSRPREFDEDD